MQSKERSGSEGSSASVIYKCPRCDATVANKCNLFRHMRSKHKIKDPGPLIAHLPPTPLKKFECEFCKKTFEGQIKRHSSSCRFNPANAPKIFLRGAELRAEEGQSIPMTSQSKLATNHKSHTDFSDDDNSFIKKFEDFLGNSQCGMKANTIHSYMTYFKKWVRFCMKEDTTFLIHKVARFGTLNANELCQVPNADSFVNSLNSISTKKQTFCMYIKFLTFLKLTSIDAPTKSCELIARIQNLDKLIQTAKTSVKKLINIIEERPVDKEVEDQERWEQITEALKAYRNSKERNDKYLRYRDMERALQEGETPAKIRDFIQLELLISGGDRPDSIYNMTLSEVLGATSPAIGKKVVFVKSHKSGKSHGTVKFIMDDSLYNLMNCYIAKVRPFCCGPQIDSADRVFTTVKGTPMESLERTCEIFKEVTGCKAKVKPYDFRYMYATYGQSQKDPNVRLLMPFYMGHSQETARNHYMNPLEQAKQKIPLVAGIEEEFGGNVKVPSIRVETGVEESLSKMKSQIKALDMEAKRSNYKSGRTILTDDERELMAQEANKFFPGQHSLTKADVAKLTSISDKFMDMYKCVKERQPRKNVTQVIISSFWTIKRNEAKAKLG